MEQLVAKISSLIWNPGLVFLCIFCGVLFTVFTRFVQVRKYREIHRLVFHGEESHGSISALKSFCLAVAGRVGTGNIVGVATAIGYGGPGAIVWMWILAFFCAGTAFVESTLSQIYKEKVHGQHRGGTSFYIEKGLGLKTLAIVVSVLIIFASCLSLIQLQSNSISTACIDSFSFNPWAIAVTLTVLVALVVIGGIKRISAFALFLTPIMTLVFLGLAIAILIVNISVVPSVIADLFTSAFGTHQIFGGILGSAISWGARRGLFSNEAGLGSFATIAGATESSHPVKAGLVQSYSVFVDTFVVCSATALMVLATKTYNVVNFATGEVLFTSPTAVLGEPDVTYTIAACQTLLGETLGGVVLSSILLLFAFTTIIACYYYGENEVAYLCRKCNASEKTHKVAISVLQLLVLVFVFYGCLSTTKFVWSLTDIGLGIVLWINLIILLIQCPKVFRTLRDYDRQQKAGIKDPVFKPSDLNIHGADFWEE